MTTFEAVRWLLIVVGLGGSGYFVATFLPAALGNRGLGGWALLDMAGWVVAAFALLLLAAVATLTGTVNTRQGSFEQTRALLTFAFIDTIVLVRALRWWRWRRRVRRDT